jgi:hypothetical protein
MSEELRFWVKVDKNGPIPLNHPELGPCWLWTMAIGKDGYGRFRLNGKKGKKVLAHRFAYLLAGHEIKDDDALDHKCHVRNCVNPVHLRPATKAQNAQNRILRIDSTSGLKCVSWNNQRHKWMARIQKEGIRVYIGVFDCPLLAFLAYRDAASALHGEFANYGNASSRIS